MEPSGRNGSGLHDRLRDVVGDRTYRALADMTGQNSETVRRYMQGQAPSVEFLASLCAHLEISADWLLTGQGPMRLPEARRHALAQANPGELLSAVAATLESLLGRVDRVEVFVQTLETRLRAGAGRAEGVVETKRGIDERAEQRGEPEAAGRDGERAGRVADALAERPPPDAG